MWLKKKAWLLSEQHQSINNNYQSPHNKRLIKKKQQQEEKPLRATYSTGTLGTVSAGKFPYPATVDLVLSSCPGHVYL